MAVSVLVRAVAGVLVTVAIGVPMLETWETLLLAVAVLALVFGAPVALTWKRVVAAVSIVAAVAGAKAILPRAGIAEAHNAFMITGPGQPLERGLPPEVFRSGKAQFDALYPPDAAPDEDRSQWRVANAVPLELYTGSADAIWRPARYTRQVDVIRFTNLGEFRGGFANDGRYNFWKGELLREQMPFYVMYELTPASVGSAIAWQGQLFWERSDGSFDEVRHDQVTARTIAPDDAGKRIYALFFPKRDPRLEFELIPSLTLRLSGWLASLLSVAGVLAVLALTIRPRWRPFGRAVLLFTIAYGVMLGFLAISAGKYLGTSYPPQGGGDDGLTHDGYGHSMALLVADGEVVEALRGFESVYWSTPGTRYVRMLEKLVFGDTNHLFALLVALTPLVVFYLIRRVAGNRPAWIVTLLFCVLPAGNLSYLQYMANAKLGYGEFVAGLSFLFGLVIVLAMSGAHRPERSLPALATAGAALAASMFIRPNFAIAVIWLGAYHAWRSWRQRDLAAVLALGAGLAFALWMPFHNWYYGGKFYLISESGTSYSLALRPAHYINAAADAVRGEFGSEAVTIASRQLRGWLWDPGFLVRPQLRPVAWALHLVKLAALLVTCWVALRWRLGRMKDAPLLGVIAIAALLAHGPMLFTYTTHFRYAMLGWDLSLVVLIGWVAHASQRRRQGAPA